MNGFDRRTPLRTFVVERQALIAKALRSYLELSSHIAVVGDAPHLSADDLIRTQPDLIFYGLDGALHGVAEALAIARNVLPEVRVCVLSSYANTTVMRHSMNSGALGFVVKDMLPSEFDAALGILASGSPYVDRRLRGGVQIMPQAQREPLLHMDDLTPREMEVLRLITCGRSNREIAGRLNIVEKTVKHHISRIFSKLGVTQRTQAAIVAIRSGFVELSSTRELGDVG